MNHIVYFISGGGIAGLLLALKLNNLGLNVRLFEQSLEYQDGVGGAIGLYPNGLRVIRDIDSGLLSKIREAGRNYESRKWMRHDGSILVAGNEQVLSGEQVLQSMGIKRWRLQRILVDECISKGIEISMHVRIDSIVINDSNIKCLIVDTLTKEKQSLECDYLFGCDGVKSAIRNSLFGKEVEPQYTGITCLMGSAPIAQTSTISGICFPSSRTSKIHACYYPCSSTEIIFQLFTQTPEQPETWRALTKHESKIERDSIHAKLVADGWHSMFTDPILHADSVLRVGLRARAPIPTWHSHSRVVLLGDAAHPPVPYIGQGAMMAIEDVGILGRLIEKLCLQNNIFEVESFTRVVEIYQRLRLPRTTAMLQASHDLGKLQLSRGIDSLEDVRAKEVIIKEEVERLGSMRVLIAGSAYDYAGVVDLELARLNLDKN